MSNQMVKPVSSVSSSVSISNFLRTTVIVLMLGVSACSSESLQTPAPKVSFKTLEYQTKPSIVFDTTALTGQVTLVNFWATSCTTCVAEMPMLAKVYTEYAPKGYRTIAVAMDYDPIDYVRNFSTSRALPSSTLAYVPSLIAVLAQIFMCV